MTKYFEGGKGEIPPPKAGKPRSPFIKGGGKMKREEEMQWPSAKAVRMKGIKLSAEC